MIRKQLTYILIFVISVATVVMFGSFHPSEHKNLIEFKTDTLRAYVSYGDQWLIDESVFIDKGELITFLDSVSKFDQHSNYGKQISFFQKAIKKPYVELTNTVDSLLKLKQVPYGIVNEINRYLIYYSYEEDFNLASENKIQEELYPGQNTYGDNWNIHHPFNYPENLTDKDSLIHIQLCQQSTEHFCHPISQQTIKKYGGKIESPFGWRDGKKHNGVDVPLDRWDTVYNVFPGKVRMARNYAGYGKVVIVRHYNGLETLYAHLQQIKVKSGQEINNGTVVGLGGSTGNSTGSHLHFEVRYKGIALNPSNLIDFNAKKLLSDTLIIKRDKNTLIGVPYGIKFHSVERGDYPLKIAQRYGISIQELCSMNNLGTRTRLRIGQQLRVSTK